MTNIPTEEQVKEFWERCGLVEQPSGSWHIDTIPSKFVSYETPDIDLNNLFKYAVPKLRYCSLQFHGITYVADVCQNFADHHVWSDTEDPALVLFWAIWEVIKND